MCFRSAITGWQRLPFPEPVVLQFGAVFLYLSGRILDDALLSHRYVLPSAPSSAIASHTRAAFSTLECYYITYTHAAFSTLECYYFTYTCCLQYPWVLLHHINVLPATPLSGITSHTRAACLQHPWVLLHHIHVLPSAPLSAFTSHTRAAWLQLTCLYSSDWV